MQKSGRSGFPNLLLVGPGDSIDAVAPALGTLRARLRRSAGIEGLEAWSQDDYLAVILADLRAVARPWRDVGTLRELTSLPLFAVLTEDSSDARIRRCYEAGASGVFEWPREREWLDRFLAEMLSLRLVRGPAERPETALARAVRARLRLLPGLDEVPRLKVRRGIVMPAGTVNSLVLKGDVEECIASVPGVKGVDVSGLHVIPDPVPDREIRRSCRRLLRGSGQVDEKTVSFTVDSGQLVFRGSARDRRELARIKRLAAGIPGVRGVEVDVVVSRQRKKLDRRTAGSLSRILDDVFPGEEVRLAFFGGVAVLTGRVRKLRTRRAIQEFLGEDPRVERVVNKLQVES